ncbi:MAG: hypothetical protein HRT68_01160 [Flavobacteriaceae bacterium]|nr:hypothetical protein [Flavobacteriaceae bacterium]
MTAENYPEIQVLKDLKEQFDIHIELIKDRFLSSETSYKGVRVKIKNKNFDLYVYDEYDDLKVDNQLLCLSLVLLELEVYDEEEDFLNWCFALGVSFKDEKIRAYHMDLRTIYADIQNLIGTIENPISDYDFQMNAGVAQYLRKL